MSLSIDRTLIIYDPGHATWNGSTLFPKDDIIITPELTPASPLMMTTIGEFDGTRIVDRKYKISFTPAGEWEDLAILFGPLAAVRGASIIGATDLPLVIKTLGGKVHTFGNVALTKLPVIRIGSKFTLFDKIELTAIIKKTTAPDALTSYYAETSAAYPGDDGFSPDAILTQDIAIEWGGSAPWSDFLARDGIVITPSIKIEPVFVGGVGTVDFKMDSASCEAKCEPVGPTLANLMAKLPAAGAFGASRVSDAADFIVNLGGFGLSMNNAVLMDGGRVHGGKHVIGECTWRATRQWTDGVASALLTLDTEPVTTPAP